VLALEGERRVPLGAPKQRALLAALLVHAGEVLTRDRLIDALWGDEPPASAAQSLQVYVHGLRKALGAGRIETHGTGYRLSLGPGELDLERFRRLVAQARLSTRRGMRPTRRTTFAGRSVSGPVRRSRISPGSRSPRPRRVA
jgi:DNA-binding SARP family transcriptional activator